MMEAYPRSDRASVPHGGGANARRMSIRGRRVMRSGGGFLGGNERGTKNEVR